MPFPAASPSPLPQRVLVVGDAGPVLDRCLSRVVQLLDLPFVPETVVRTTADATELAAFDGWITTAADRADLRAVLLERADLVVHVLAEAPGTLRGLVRRTVRRLRTDEPQADTSWLDRLRWTHPGLEVVRLEGPGPAEAWLQQLSTAVR